MIYRAYQSQADFMVPLRALAAQALASFEHMPFKTDHLYTRSVRAACEMLTRAGLSHHRPSFRIDSITIDEQEYAISEEAVLVTPFATVPAPHAGAGRRVYPGFVQLGAFMSMNLSRHVKEHLDLYAALVQGKDQEAHATKTFYDEYFAVLDLPAEFYLETVNLIFQEYALPLGKLEWRGTPIEPRAIRRTALLTVEGEKDDICSVGQTLAAQDLCSGLWPNRKRHHMQAGVGHYGVFSGRRWASQIYPLVRNVILAND